MKTLLIILGLIKDAEPQEARPFMERFYEQNPRPAKIENFEEFYSNLYTQLGYKNIPNIYKNENN